MYTLSNEGKYHQIFSLISLPSSRSTDCLHLLQKECCDVVSKCLKKLGSNGFRKETLDTLEGELRQLLVKIRSFPPAVNGLMVELGMLYNLIYASLLKCEINKHDKTSLLMSHSNTTFRSLHRVQDLVGTNGQASLTSQTNSSCSETATGQGSVPLILSDLIGVLHSVGCKALRDSVGSVACLWSLLTLLEQGVSTPLPCLHPLADLTDDGDTKVSLKHGFLFPTSATSLLTSGTSDKGFSLQEREASHTSWVKNIANILLAVSSFHRSEFSLCQEHAAKVEDPELAVLSQVLTARATLGSGRCLEAIGILHTLLDSDQSCGDNEVKSYIYRLLAACYSAQNLPHLAVEMLRCCLQLKPNVAGTLYSLAEQFRSMRQPEAEIQCLHIMVKTLEQTENETEESSAQLQLLDNFLHTVVTSGDEISLQQSLYLLASRCAVLKRYKESAEAYLRLIQIFQSRVPGLPRHQRVHVPDMLTVCQEAAKILLLCGQYQQCLELCNKVLTAVAASPSSPDLDRDQTNLMCASKSSHDNRRARGIASRNLEGQSQATETDGGREVKTGKKRRLSSGRELETLFDEERGTEWTDRKNQVLVMQHMAEALVREGSDAEAVSILNRSLDRLLGCQAGSGGQRSKMGEAERGQCVTSNPKRPRFSTGESGDREDVQEMDNDDDDDDWRSLTCSVCIKLADLSDRLHSRSQALHFSRLAVQLQPDKENAQFYLSSVLEGLGRCSEGSQRWLQLRGLPHNTGSVHWRKVLQENQENLRNLPPDSNNESRELGIVSARQKLDLDIMCLKTLSGSKLNK